MTSGHATDRKWWSVKQLTGRLEITKRLSKGRKIMQSDAFAKWKRNPSYSFQYLLAEENLRKKSLA